MLDLGKAQCLLLFYLLLLLLPGEGSVSIEHMEQCHSRKILSSPISRRLEQHSLLPESSLFCSLFAYIPSPSEICVLCLFFCFFMHQANRLNSISQLFRRCKGKNSAFPLRFALLPSCQSAWSKLSLLSEKKKKKKVREQPQNGEQNVFSIPQPTEAARNR